jgi:hypothetical protein
MVALSSDSIEKIMAISDDVEPYIVNIIKESDESNCPYKIVMEGSLGSNEAKDAVTRVTRVLYQQGLLNRMDLSLADDEALSTIWYAFGYWGGKTLNKHGNKICTCRNKCYQNAFLD